MKTMKKFRLIDEADTQARDIDGKIPKWNCKLEEKYVGRGDLNAPIVEGSWCPVHEHWFFTPQEREISDSEDAFGDSHGL